MSKLTTLFFSVVLLFVLIQSCSRPAAPVFDKEFILTVNTQGEGSVSQRVVNEMDILAGIPKRVELTATPAEGWEFSEWQGAMQGQQNPVMIALDTDKELMGVFVQATSGSWPRDTQTTVVDVTNPVTGRTWMDRNLGASRAATSSTDTQAYGDLYQWGRAADGHQKRNSGTTSNQSNTDQPGHGDFIITTDEPTDWRSPQNDDLWQGGNGINNPCPNGYRIPTLAEWDEEQQSWDNDAFGAINSPLKIPLSGSRNYERGDFPNVGIYGRYWSSTIDSTGVQRLQFREGGSARLIISRRANGYSVRCIKDDTSD